MEMKEMGQRARAAARLLAHAASDQKDTALRAVASRLVSERVEILAANARDIADARAAQIAPALLDR